MQRPSKRQKRRVKLSARSEQRLIRPKNKIDWGVSRQELRKTPTGLRKRA